MRNRIQISGKDVRELRTKLEHMDLSDMKSLKEFLTVTPVLARDRIRVGFSRSGSFGAYNIVTTPHAKVLTDEYPSRDNEQTLSLNI